MAINIVLSSSSLLITFTYWIPPFMLPLHHFWECIAKALPRFMTQPHHCTWIANNNHLMSNVNLFSDPPLHDHNCKVIKRCKKFGFIVKHAHHASMRVSKSVPADKKSFPSHGWRRISDIETICSNKQDHCRIKWYDNRCHNCLCRKIQERQ